LPRRVADQRQAPGRNPPAAALEFEMQHDLVREQSADLRDRRLEPIGRIARLEIGDRAIDLQRVQRRVIPRAFVKRPGTGPVSGGRAIADLAAFRLDQLLERPQRRLGNHCNQAIATCGEFALEMPEIGGDWPG
jgi:hypothetical protein